MICNPDAASLVYDSEYLRGFTSCLPTVPVADLGLGDVGSCPGWHLARGRHRPATHKTFGLVTFARLVFYAH